MAEYMSGRLNRPAFVGDVSERGIHIAILNNKGAERLFVPGRTVELKFRLSSGESISLLCEVKWISQKKPPDGVTDSVGLEIIDPPSQYVSFVQALY